MKKLSDKRIKELIEIEKDGILYIETHTHLTLKDGERRYDIISALQELLELRKSQPKFKIGQKNIWIIKFRNKWVVDFYRDDNGHFPTKPEAQAECDRRNKKSEINKAQKDANEAINKVLDDLKTPEGREKHDTRVREFEREFYKKPMQEWHRK